MCWSLRMWLGHRCIPSHGRGGQARLLTLLLTIPAGGAQIHDANIVATMQAYGIQRLLTENVADFARFAGVITLVPLGVHGSSPPVPPA
jgi:hypothetical protein